MPLTSYELRLKKLYDYAYSTNQLSILNGLGFIILNGNYNEPTSIYRHRHYVNELAKQSLRINELKQQLDNYFNINEENLPQQLKWERYKQQRAKEVISCGSGNFIRIASNNGPIVKMSRSFRRAR